MKYIISLLSSRILYALLAGTWSDRHGRKPLLVLAVCGQVMIMMMMIIMIMIMMIITSVAAAGQPLLRPQLRVPAVAQLAAALPRAGERRVRHLRVLLHRRVQLHHRHLARGAEVSSTIRASLKRSRREIGTPTQRS